MATTNLTTNISNTITGTSTHISDCPGRQLVFTASSNSTYSDPGSLCTKFSIGFPYSAPDSMEFAKRIMDLPCPLLKDDKKEPKNKPLLKSYTESRFTPKRILYNDPATIVFWKDGTKTVVKRSLGEPWNCYNAFCAALAKKIFGNNSIVNKIVKSGQTVSKETSSPAKKVSAKPNAVNVTPQKKAEKPVKKNHKKK